MTEYVRKDKNGAAIKVGDRVQISNKPADIQGVGIVVEPTQKGWAISEDIVWIKWEECKYNSVVGRILWSECSTVAKLNTEPKPETKPKPHVHAELIKMWADDPSIVFQWRVLAEVWKDCHAEVGPCWEEAHSYRLKPKEKKFADKYAYYYRHAQGTFESVHVYSENEWDDFRKKYNITDFTRLDWTKVSVEVKD